MPCDSKVPQGMTQEQREAQIDASVRRLEQQLGNDSVKLVIGESGAVAFEGWTNRDGVADVCAFRRLSVANSFALQQAVATAEAMSGRRVDANAVAAGVHSHDGGNTWHKGH